MTRIFSEIFSMKKGDSTLFESVSEFFVFCMDLLRFAESARFKLTLILIIQKKVSVSLVCGFFRFLESASFKHLKHFKHF